MIPTPHKRTPSQANDSGIPHQEPTIRTRVAAYDTIALITKLIPTSQRPALSFDLITVGQGT
jgi:hypothetical protein